MPAYISHAIMADNFYEDNYRNNKIFKIEINCEELKSHSLGPDLVTLSKRLNCDPHDNKTQVYFLSMIKYIVDNNLSSDKTIMATLYGHILHYFFDISAHPFIYYVEKGCQRVGIISNHHLVEGYLDSYLADKILHKDIMDIKSSYFNKMIFTKKLIDMLNNVYGKIYGDNNIIQTYKGTLSLFTLIEDFVKQPLMKKEDLIRLAKFKEFMLINNLSFNDLNNENCRNYYHPITGKIKNNSFLGMYYKAIFKSLLAINEVNKVIYDGKSIISLEKIFTNLSFNTGLECNNKNKMIYVKKR